MGGGGDRPPACTSRDAHPPALPSPPSPSPPCRSPFLGSSRGRAARARARAGVERRASLPRRERRSVCRDRARVTSVASFVSDRSGATARRAAALCSGRCAGSRTRPGPTALRRRERDRLRPADAATPASARCGAEAIGAGRRTLAIERAPQSGSLRVLRPQCVERREPWARGRPRRAPGRSMRSCLTRVHAARVSRARSLGGSRLRSAPLARTISARREELGSRPRP